MYGAREKRRIMAGFLNFVLIFLINNFNKIKADEGGSSNEVNVPRTAHKREDFVFWPNAVIPFYIDSEHFDNDQSLSIMRTLSIFSYKTCLKFAPVVERPKNNDHVMLFENPKGVKFCAINTDGHSIEEPHKVILGYECLKSPQIEMMIMNALGFPFEHNRAIRDVYITVNPENVVPGYIELFTMESKLSPELRALPYDMNSVLHFGERDFTKNGHRTIIFKGSKVVQHREGLSDLDLRKISLIYGPECLRRDRQEKLDECQNYPGILDPTETARKKREVNVVKKDIITEKSIDVMYGNKSLRVNPNITPPPDLLSKNDDITKTLKELGIEREVEIVVDEVNKLSALALKRARERYCNDTKETLRADNSKIDILQILQAVTDYAKIMVDHAVQNLTEFCIQSQSLHVYQRAKCPFFEASRCQRTSFRSTLPGLVKYSTQHRPVMKQSTKHEGSYHPEKNQYEKIMRAAENNATTNGTEQTRSKRNVDVDEMDAEMNSIDMLFRDDVHRAKRRVERHENLHEAVEEINRWKREAETPAVETATVETTSASSTSLGDKETTTAAVRQLDVSKEATATKKPASNDTVVTEIHKLADVRDGPNTAANVTQIKLRETDAKPETPELIGNNTKASNVTAKRPKLTTKHASKAALKVLKSNKTEIKDNNHKVVKENPLLNKTVKLSNRKPKLLAGKNTNTTIKTPKILAVKYPAKTTRDPKKPRLLSGKAVPPKTPLNPKRTDNKKPKPLSAKVNAKHLKSRVEDTKNTTKAKPHHKNTNDGKHGNKNKIVTGQKVTTKAAGKKTSKADTKSKKKPAERRRNRRFSSRTKIKPLQTDSGENPIEKILRGSSYVSEHGSPDRYRERNQGNERDRESKYETRSQERDKGRFHREPDMKSFKHGLDIKVGDKEPKYYSNEQKGYKDREPSVETINSNERHKPNYYKDFKKTDVNDEKPHKKPRKDTDGQKDNYQDVRDQRLKTLQANEQRERPDTYAVTERVTRISKPPSRLKNKRIIEPNADFKIKDNREKEPSIEGKERVKKTKHNVEQAKRVKDVEDRYREPGRGKIDKKKHQTVVKEDEIDGGVRDSDLVQEREREIGEIQKLRQGQSRQENNEYLSLEDEEVNEAPTESTDEGYIPSIVQLSKQNKEFYRDRKWPDNVIRYIIFDDGTIDVEDVRARLEEINDILKAKTCVYLEEITEDDTGRFEDYLVLDASPDYVTGRVGGRQSFGVVELLRGGQHRQHTAMMVMAMLGFYFEVSRHDRDKYIRVHTRHIRADKLHHFEKIRSDATFNLPYDYRSATHPAWQFWRQLGRTGISTVATFKEKDPEGTLMKTLGQNDELLSELDLVKINSVYGVRCFSTDRTKH